METKITLRILTVAQIKTRIKWQSGGWRRWLTIRHRYLWSWVKQAEHTSTESSCTIKYETQRDISQQTRRAWRRGQEENLLARGSPSGPVPDRTTWRLLLSLRICPDLPSV